MIPSESDPHRCDFNDHGYRCANIGTLSPGTLGGGPWYCRDHAHVFLHDLRPAENYRKGWQKVGEAIRAQLAGREPGQEG